MAGFSTTEKVPTTDGVDDEEPPEGADPLDAVEEVEPPTALLPLVPALPEPAPPTPTALLVVSEDEHPLLAEAVRRHETEIRILVVVVNGFKSSSTLLDGKSGPIPQEPS